MIIYIGADHRGFRLKEALRGFIVDLGYEVVDCGATSQAAYDDYVDYVSKVAERVSRDPEHILGIAICGSGVGADVTANKFTRVRSALGFANDQVFSARHDDDANVLSLASDFTNEDAAKAMVKIFLETPFGNDERYRRRVDKILQIEHS